MSAAIIIGGGTLALGAIQAISGAAKAKAAQKAIAGQKTPTYTPNKAINDYYQTALNRANAGPYNSVGYGVQKNLNQQGLAAGLAGAQDRRSGVQAAGALTQQFANNNMKAGAQAEQEGNRAFAQLGQATGAKSGDDKFAYEQNQVAPYQKNMQLNYARLGGANSLVSAGLSNIGSGLNTGALGVMRGNGQYGGYGGGNYNSGGNTFGPQQTSGWGFQ
jgi:hypothetical protein